MNKEEILKFIDELEIDNKIQLKDIPDLDLYIEYQGTWTHGLHPFNENNKEDIDKLNLWKSKNSKYYDNAINTWTIRDVNKRNIAKQNNLNWIEFFNFDNFKKWLNNNE